MNTFGTSKGPVLSEATESCKSAARLLTKTTSFLSQGPTPTTQSARTYRGTTQRQNCTSSGIQTTNAQSCSIQRCLMKSWPKARKICLASRTLATCKTHSTRRSSKRRSKKRLKPDAVLTSLTRWKTPNFEKTRLGWPTFKSLRMARTRSLRRTAESKIEVN